MAIAEDKDTFDSFLKKYQIYRTEFNVKQKMNIQDEIEKFDVNSHSGRTLAAVVLMLVHNKYKPNAKYLPNINNIQTYDLKKLETIDLNMFTPYIEILRQGKKEKKASKEVSASARQIKFIQTFIRYLSIAQKLGIKTIKSKPEK